MADHVARRGFPSSRNLVTGESKLHEQSFNLEFGKLLRCLSPVWNDSKRRAVQIERVTAQRKRPDIVVTNQNSAPVAIEISYTHADADRDARSRLGQRISNFSVRTALAVVPPKGTQNLSDDEAPEFLKTNVLSYAVHFQGDGRFPEAGWIEGDMHDFAEFLLAAEIPPSTLNETAQKAKDAISEAADILFQDLGTHSLDDIAQAIHEPDPERAVQAAVLCIFNALHAQDSIALANSTVFARSKCKSNAGEHPILPAEISQAWNAIRDIDYQPIYKVAQECLDAARTNVEAASRALSVLDKVVDEVLAQGINPGRELAQAIFPLIVQDRKNSAAFYTKPPVASMLLHLAYAKTEEILQFGGGGGVEFPRIADFACGTGRLIGTAYDLVREAAERHGIDPRCIHSSMVENHLSAADIQPTATHLTATNLAMKEPNIPCKGTRIGVMPVTSRNTPTGTLELIRQESIQDLFDLNTLDSGKSSSIDARHGSFSLVVMNPPYSRTRKNQPLFDIANMTDEQRTTAQKQAQRLVQKTPANLQAGLASCFAHLAHVKLGPSGRLGLVLPLTAAMAETWRDTRSHWERHYTNILCITHAGGSSGEQAMSEDTGMGEMLLLARKGRKNRTQQKITSVTLRVPIPHALAGRCIARAIHSSIQRHAENNAYGSITLASKTIGSFTRELVDGKGDPWLGAGLLDPSLASSMIKITQKTLWTPACTTSISIGVPIVPLNSILNTGPTHDLIGYPYEGSPRGGFCFNKITPDSPHPADPALWAADSTIQKKLVVEPTHEGTAINEQSASKMRQAKSHLFISRNLRYTSQALVAAFVPDPVMGGRAWNAIQNVSQVYCKAYTLWFNSVLGILLHFKEAQRQQQGRGTFGVEQLGNLLIPDFRQLAKNRLKQTQKTFDIIAQKEMLPVTDLNEDPVRAEIDEAIIRLLDLPATASNALKDLRKRLSREPTISGKAP